MRNNIKDMLYPFVLPASIAAILQNKLVTIEDDFRTRQEALQKERNSSLLDEHEPTALERLHIAQVKDLETRLMIAKACVGHLAYTYGDKVYLKVPPETVRARNADVDRRMAALTEEARARHKELIVVAKKMMTAHVAAIRVKMPTELLAELDAIGKETK